MTNYLMGAGSVRVKGPVSTANQILNHDSETYCWRSVNLIASGTGKKSIFFNIINNLGFERDNSDAFVY
jgi:hypothetical protein